MKQEWFYAKDGKQHGPVTPATIRKLASNGQITGDDQVWREGLDAWVPARQISGLFSEGQSGADGSEVNYGDAQADHGPPSGSPPPPPRQVPPAGDQTSQSTATDSIESQANPVLDNLKAFEDGLTHPKLQSWSLRSCGAGLLIVAYYAYLARSNMLAGMVFGSALAVCGALLAAAAIVAGSKR